MPFSLSPRRFAAKRRLARGLRLQTEALEGRSLLAVLPVFPGDSIQDAIDTAAPGDTVLVAPGTYNEQLNIDKSLILRGLSGNPNDVVIAPGPFDFGDGITVEPGVRSVSIENLRVTGWSDEGIILGDDFLFLPGVGRATLFNIVADNNGDDGIDANRGARLNISYVRTTGNAGDGIDVDAMVGSLNIRHTRSTENGDEGLELTEHDGAVNLVHFTASRNGDDGVDISSFLAAGDLPDVTIIGGRFDANGVPRGGRFANPNGDGLDITDVASLSVTGIAAIGNRHNGLLVDGVVGDVSILDGLFQRNGQFDGQIFGDGVDLNNIGGSATLRAVRSSGNFAHGVSFFDVFNIDIAASLFQRNGDSGLSMFDVGDVRLQGVQSTYNGLDGLDIDFANDVTLIGSLFAFNDDDGLDLDQIGALVRIGAIAIGNGNFDFEPLDQDF